MPIIIESDRSVADDLERALTSTPGTTTLLTTIDNAAGKLEAMPEEYTVVLGPSVLLPAALALADTLRVIRPALSVVLLRDDVDTQVLTDALRAGVREVASARDEPAVHQAVQRSHALYEAMTQQADLQRTVPAQGQVVTVFSAKGGVGKTTVSTNLAVALADGGSRSVCLVDLDLSFGDVAITLQIFPIRTIADAVTMGADLDLHGLESLLTPYRDEVQCLVAPTSPDAKDSISALLVGKVLELLRGRFDYVVVDTPPAFDDQVLQAFDCSDLILLITTPDIPALKNLKIALETLSLLNFPREQSLLVLNRAQPKVGITAEEVSTTLGMPIIAMVPSSAEIPASINRGEPIVLSDPRHPCSRGFFALVESILEHHPARRHEADDASPQVDKVGAPVRRRGMFSRRKAA
jgi:pilus assembly protein CpaE